MGSAPEDRDFLDALEGVKPLPAPRRAELRRAKPAPYPKQSQLDERAVLAESLGPPSLDDTMESGEELTFSRNGYSPELLRRLRRGHWVVEAQLDLHGMNRLEAAVAVSEFLRTCRAQHRRCVRIVHGKGLGVLKGMLRKRLPLQDEVGAFVQAPAAQGGSGALLLLLRK